MYKVVVPERVLKTLKKLNKEDKKLILKKLEELEKGIFFNDKPLKGKYKGKFRKRAGNFRIIYFKEEDIITITIIRIAHKKEVY